MDAITDELVRQAVLWQALTFCEAQNPSEKPETPGKTPQAETPAEVRPADGGWMDLAQTLLVRSESARSAIPFAQREMQAAGVSAHRLTDNLGAETAADSDATVLYSEASWTAEPARELSRAFERDARRYDGGFSLF